MEKDLGLGNNLLDLFQQLNNQLGKSNNYLDTTLTSSLSTLIDRISPMEVDRVRLDLDKAKLIDDDIVDIIESIRDSSEDILENTETPNVLGRGHDNDTQGPRDFHDAVDELTGEFSSSNETLGYKIVGEIGGAIAGISFSGLFDDAKEYFNSVNQSYREIAHKLSMDPEEIKKVRGDIKDLYDTSLNQYSGMISQGEILESFQDSMTTFNLTNTEEARKITASLTELKAATGEDVRASQIESIYDVLKASGLDMSLASDTMNDLIHLSTKYGANYEDMLDSLSGIDGVLTRSSIDEATYRKSMYSALKSSAILKKDGLDIDDKILDDYVDAFSNIFNTSEQRVYHKLGLGVDQTNKILSGDIGGAKADFVKAIQDIYNRESVVGRQYWSKELEIPMSEMAKIASMSPEDIAKMSEIDRDISQSGDESLQKAINDTSRVSALEQAKNRLSFTQGFNEMSDIVDRIDNSVVGSTLTSILKMVTSIAIYQKASSIIGGILGKIGDKGLTKAVGEGASKVFSKGATGTMLSVGATNALQTAANVVPGATALTYGVVDGGKAIYHGVSGDHQKAAEDVGHGVGGVAGALGGAKAGALAGAAIGTAVPIVGNVVGAAVGGILGSIGGGVLGSKAGEGLFGWAGEKLGLKNKSEENKIDTHEIVGDKGGIEDEVVGDKGGIPEISEVSESFSSKELDMESDLFKSLGEMSSMIIKYFTKNSYLFDRPLGIFSRLNEVGFAKLIEEGTKALISAVGGSTRGLGLDSSSDDPLLGDGGFYDMMDQVGVVSAKYETGGWNPGKISSGAGDFGGKSYGVSQFTSAGGGASANEFISWVKRSSPEFGSLFSSAGKAGSSSFDTAWTRANNLDSKKWGELQSAYTFEKYVTPFIKRAKDKTGVDLSKSRALQELAYSTSVQFGPAGTKALGNINPSMSDEEIIKTSFAAKRANVDSWFRSSSSGVRNSLRTNRFVNEEKDILALVGRSPSRDPQIQLGLNYQQLQGDRGGIEEDVDRTSKQSRDTMQSSIDSGGADKIVAAIYDAQSRNEKFLAKNNNQPRDNSSSQEDSRRSLLTSPYSMRSMMSDWMDEGKQII